MIASTVVSNHSKIMDAVLMNAFSTAAAPYTETKPAEVRGSLPPACLADSVTYVLDEATGELVYALRDPILEAARVELERMDEILKHAEAQKECEGRQQQVRLFSCAMMVLLFTIQGVVARWIFSEGRGTRDSAVALYWCCWALFSSCVTGVVVWTSRFDAPFDRSCFCCFVPCAYLICVSSFWIYCATE
jgi:hypothetical protein